MTLTPQEIFDTAVGGVLAQGALSKRQELSMKSCLYRGPNGLKCAVGQLLDDETARACDEETLSAIDELPSDLIPEHLHPHIPLLVKLQTLHDSSNSIEEFRDGAREFAKHRKLNWSFA